MMMTLRMLMTMMMSRRRITTTMKTKMRCGRCCGEVASRSTATLGRRRAVYAQSQRGNSTRSPAGCIIRRARVDDVKSVAELCGTAFYPDDRDGSGTSTGTSNARPGLREGVERVLTDYQRQRLSLAVEKALRGALRRKNKANGIRIRARRGWARFEAPYAGGGNRREADDTEFMMESRVFNCLICCDTKTNEVVGAAFVFLYRAKADTPPPLPTNAPFQMYLSNLSVDRRWRGRGIANRIMDEAERFSRLVGYDELLLHVQPKNAVAYGMYTRRGYVELGLKRWWNGDQLLRKALVGVRPPFLARAGESKSAVVPMNDDARCIEEIEAELNRLDAMRSKLRVEEDGQTEQ